MKFISYILLVYFSIGACIPRSDFSQISQLDDLLDHYKLHQEEAVKAGAKISFFVFLRIHFIQGDEHKHPNENEHQNLPLYSICSGILLFVYQVDNTWNLVTALSEEREITFQNSFYLKPFIHQVFHPPCQLR